jgi:nucleoside-diphosphate-sugar epimerase
MAEACRVLVTGGAGFVGATLVRRLVRRGNSVRVFDNYSTGAASHLAGVDAEQVHGRAAMITWDRSLTIKACPR